MEKGEICLDEPNQKPFIADSNTMDDVYNNINDYSPKRKQKRFIVFDDMISDINTNKKFQAIVKNLFIRGRKLNISLVFRSKRSQIKCYTLSNNEDSKYCY